MTFLWSLWEMAINIIEILVFAIFLTKRLEYEKENKLKIWFGFVALVIFLTALNFLFVPPIVVTSLMTLASIIYAIIAFYNQNNKGKCMFWGCSYSVISFISNSIVDNIAVRRTGFPGPDILSQSTFRFEMMCLYILVYIVLFLGLDYLTKYNKKNFSMPFRARWLLFTFVLLGTIAAGLIAKITILSGSNQSVENNQSILLTAIVTGILFVIIIFTMVLFEYLGVLYEKNLQLKLSVQRQKNEAAHYQSIKENYQEIREWKHDYHNHLLVIDEYIKNQQYDKLQNFICQLNQACGEIGQFVDTGNSTINAVIYNKMLIAKYHAIPFTYNIVLTKSLAISDLNLSSVLGNLLDNALEASINVPKSLQNNVFVDLKISIQKQMVLICISNYYSGKLSYKEGKIATLKKDLVGHGIGLNRVEKLLQQENGFLNLKAEKQVFTAEVLLPAREEVV